VCFIGGCLLLEGAGNHRGIEDAIKALIRLSELRGTDGAGFAVIGENPLESRDLAGPSALLEQFNLTVGARAVLINSRLEPTSEYLPNPQSTDLQPYSHGGVTVVHNGLIANDQQLRAQYSINLKDIGTRVDSGILPHLLKRFGGVRVETLRRLAKEVDGSYAIAAHDQSDQNRLYLACSYKPLWIATSSELRAIFFASEAALLQDALGPSVDLGIERVPPYTGLAVSTECGREPFDLDFRPRDGAALCVCSGGMDSTTAAAIVRDRGEQIILCHFLYECKAQAREQRAVKQIAKHYGAEMIFVPMPWLGQLGGSSLTVEDIPIAEGTLGVETAHEWVPARNLLMIAHAVALCERYQFGRIVLGLNEQEGEVFPDNEMEFLTNLQSAIGIGSTSRIMLEAPLARMSKRDIVRVGLELNVPLHLTWSCYHSGELPCGTCGSCLQRRVAFMQLGREDFLEYSHPIPTSAAPYPV
jgi:7-cyano-7-deazaguanine synthase